MDKSYIKIILVSCYILFTVNCTYRLVDFTVVSIGNHSLPANDIEMIAVEGKSLSFLGINSTIDDAVEDALAKAGPNYDMLINGVVRIKDYYLVTGFEVQGSAIRSSDLKYHLVTGSIDSSSYGAIYTYHKKP